jgi:PKD repeat protein
MKTPKVPPDEGPSYRRVDIDHTACSRTLRRIPAILLALLLPVASQASTVPTTVLDRRIAAASDDAEQSPRWGLSLYSPDIDLVVDADAQQVGLRFTNLAIPKGATVTRAYLQFETQEERSEATSLAIRGQAADSPVTFSAAADVMSRPGTVASVSWAPAPWLVIGEAGAEQRTPDLATVIQEIVDRPGWASGNALVVLIGGTGHRTARSYEGSVAGAALLHVEYGINVAPVVNAGPDQVITLPAAATLNGTAADDGLPLPATLTGVWTAGSRPGPVTFQDATAMNTQASFTIPGVYVLQLSASDGRLSGADSMMVTVRPDPLAVPADEVHWTFMGQTSVALDWRGSDNLVRYGTTPDYGQTATGVTPTPLPWSSPGPFWEVTLTGLQEDTIYHYSIGGSPDHTFHTPPPRGSTRGFSIFAHGDIGDAVKYPRGAPINAKVAASRPDFVLMLGDLTYGYPNGQLSVDRHFNDVMGWSWDAAYMPIWGNHEWGNAVDDLRNYKGRFALPNPQTSPNAPVCCSEDWYWFDYGNVRFIAYPESYPTAWSVWRTQAATLMNQAQADPAIRFIVTFGHKPAYSSGYHAADPPFTSYLDAMGDTYSKYVLNLNAHSHNYERSYPQHGVVHVTSGTGGAPLEKVSGTCIWAGGCPPPSWSAFRAMHHVTLQLTFNANTIAGEVLCGPAEPGDEPCVSGTVLDTFLIGGENNQAPAAALSISPATGNAPLDVTANASASTDADGSIRNYRFDFGDGSVVSSSSPMASHFYRPGSWTLTSTVTDDAGAADSASGTVIVADTPSGPNLISNPSFEADAAAWNSYSGAVLQRVPGGFDGDWGLRVTGNLTTAGFGINDSPNQVATVPAAGTKYRITAWVRSESHTGTAKLQIREYLGSSRVGWVYSDGVPLSPTWQAVSMDYTTAAAGSNLDCQVIDFPNVPGETFITDNIAIRDVTGTPTAVALDPTSRAPLHATLSPAPLRPSSVLLFSTTRSGRLSVTLYDVTGRRVRRLMHVSGAPAGLHRVAVDGKDEQGRALASGVYFFRIEAAEGVSSGRLVVAR